MFCANCGRKIEGAGKFCPKCGAPLAAEVRNTRMQPCKKTGKSLWVAAGGVLVLLVGMIAGIFLVRGTGRHHVETYVLNAEDDHVMDWKDPALEEQMHRITGIDGDIRLSDVYYLTELNLAYGGGEAVTDISKSRNLKYLALGGVPARDISALSGLKNLETLMLGYLEISDISALSGLANLKNLQLVEMKVDDITALSGLEKLEMLDLEGCPVQDISALSELKGLKKLAVMDCPVQDISALSGLNSLEYIELTGTQVTDISALSGLTNLQTVNW